MRFVRVVRVARKCILFDARLPGVKTKTLLLYRYRACGGCYSQIKVPDRRQWWCFTRSGLLQKGLAFGALPISDTRRQFNCVLGRVYLGHNNNRGSKTWLLQYFKVCSIRLWPTGMSVTSASLWKCPTKVAYNIQGSDAITAFISPSQRYISARKLLITLVQGVFIVKKYTRSNKLSRVFRKSYTKVATRRKGEDLRTNKAFVSTREQL